MKRPLMRISLFVASFLFPCILFAQIQNEGVIKGKLAVKGGGPLKGGTVYLFDSVKGPAPDPDKYWRIPDEISEINADGEFSIKLPEGKYHIGGILRASGKNEIGPPLVGDLFYISRDDKGKPALYTIKKGETLDLGTVAEAVPFKGVVTKDKITGVDGRVVFGDGRPVEGAYVFAYLSPTMVGKPSFVSDRTGKDGKFLLRVSEGGSYYLRVRDIYGGGPPVPGAIIGSYGQDTPAAVNVKKDEITKGIDIVVKRFPGRGQEKKQ